MGYISYGFMGNRRKTQELHFLSLEHLFNIVKYVFAYQKKQFPLTVTSQGEDNSSFTH